METSTIRDFGGEDEIKNMARWVCHSNIWRLENRLRRGACEGAVFWTTDSACSASITRLGRSSLRLSVPPNNAFNLGSGQEKSSRTSSPRSNIPIPRELSLDCFLGNKATVGVHSHSFSHGVPLPESVEPVSMGVSHKFVVHRYHLSRQRGRHWI